MKSAALLKEEDLSSPSPPDSVRRIFSRRRPVNVWFFRIAALLTQW